MTRLRLVLDTLVEEIKKKKVDSHIHINKLL